MHILFDTDVLQRWSGEAPDDFPGRVIENLLESEGEEGGNTHRLVLALNICRPGSLEYGESLLRRTTSPHRVTCYAAPSSCDIESELRHLFYESIAPDIVVRGLASRDRRLKLPEQSLTTPYSFREVVLLGAGEEKLEPAQLTALLAHRILCIDVGGLYSGQTLPENLRPRLKTLPVGMSPSILQMADEGIFDNPEEAAPDRSAHATLALARPRLAIVSPLPPAKSGIANYTCELVPSLSSFYNITLVTEVSSQTVDPRITDFPVIGIDDFRDRAHEFGRILYHFGNSPYHAFMIDLLARYPGCVVLHDVFLADLHNYFYEHHRQQPAGFSRETYMNHGYQGLIDQTNLEATRFLERYPLSRCIVEQSRGLIVHSRHARELLLEWYGVLAARDVFEIPHLRGIPNPVEAHTGRQALGISDDRLVLATFGGITASKYPLKLLDAFLASSLAQRDDVLLVFVGGLPEGALKGVFEQQLLNAGCAADIWVTGYVDNDTYARYLQAIDIGVQLRSASRGETSGAAVDVMAHGKALVVNAHGTLAELPSEAAWVLEDEFTRAELVEAFERLSSSMELRAQLGRAAREHVQKTRQPSIIAGQYREAIESVRVGGRWAPYDRALVRLAPALDAQDATQLNDVAQALAINLPSSGAPRLLLDITALTITDLKTGIERVTRKLAWFMLHEPPEGWRVEPIYWYEGQFYLARRFSAELLGIGAVPAEDRPADAVRGDIYLSLEWSPPVLDQARDAFRWMRLKGVEIHFIVFDLLPLELPRYFPGEIEGLARHWFESVIRFADGLHCISNAVAQQVKKRLALMPAATPPPVIEHFPLGADFGGSVASQGLRDKDRALLGFLEASIDPVLLMVGTLEPRKGHQLMFEAFDRLRARGVRVQLVIAGKLGWKMDDFAHKLRQHPDYGHSLHWVEGASDEMIERLYQKATALVAASEGEGFGLPLVEAAFYGVPVIARDIPVFREVGGEYARYFDAVTPGELSHWLEELLQAPDRLVAPAIDEITTWQSCAQELLKQVIGPVGTARNKATNRGAARMSQAVFDDPRKES